MKKQNNEGFALAYVMVVIVVLCTISLALMSTTLRVLQAQQNSVERMQAKYEVQGEIEKLAVEMSDAKYYESHISNFSGTLEVYAKDDSEAQSEALDELELKFIEKFEDYIDPTRDECISFNKETQTAVVEFCADGGTVKVTAHLMLAPSVRYEVESCTRVDEVSNTDGEFKYSVACAYELTDMAVEFMSYEISDSEGGGS